MALGNALMPLTIDIVPPDESNQIRKESPEKVISSRGVWTKKDDEKRDENEKEELVLKCRVVGRGFQEEYDENLRRDSPTCSTLLVQIICSLASSRLMKLTAADVRGAFLQGLKIDRELYFEPPKNLGKAQIPGVQPGALLKLNQEIHLWCERCRKTVVSLHQRNPPSFGLGKLDI